MATGLDTKHLENVCRLCLTDATEAGHMLPIFPVRGGNPNSPTSMVNRIHQCTSLKLEHKDGVPATICELCSVRLEDWYAFREQCLGTDEYLRTALAHLFAATESTHDMAPHTDVGPLPTAQTSSSSSSSSSRMSSLAKRRQSTMEWAVNDGKGNSTGQKVIVEVLDQSDNGGAGMTKPALSPPAADVVEAAYEPLSPQTPEHNGGRVGQGQQGVVVTLPLDANLLLEQASWSKEYSARVNSLMVLVSGPRPYKCKICHKLFKARSNLRRHIKLSHSDEVIEGESPPPECYDFGHIHRAGAAARKEERATGEEASFEPDQQQQQQQVQQQQRGIASSGVPAKRRRKATDPPITGPYKCHVCPRSFKMAAHLAVHMKTHTRMEELPASGGLIEQQLQQKLLEQQQVQQSTGDRTASSSRRSSVFSERSRKTNIEPSDIIQLSDDEDEDIPQQQQQHQTVMDDDNDKTHNQSDELDDGFDEEEGSLKEGGVPSSGDDSSTLAESGAQQQTAVLSTTNVNDDDDDDVVIQEVLPSPNPPRNSADQQPKAKMRLTIPGTIPPGPLSMKQKYRASLENGDIPPGKQFPFIVARPKHQADGAQQQQQQQQQQRRSSPSTTVDSLTPPAPEDTKPLSATAPIVVLHRCHFCSQAFPREDLLRAHQKTMHQTDAAFPFRCRWCQKGFRYRQNYTLHVEKQTCRLLNGDGSGGGAGGATTQPSIGAKLSAQQMRPTVTASKRSW